MFIPKGYDNFDEDINQAVPSLFNFETGFYMSINSVWQIRDSQYLVNDLSFRIKRKRSNNNDMHQE